MPYWATTGYQDAASLHASLRELTFPVWLPCCALGYMLPTSTTHLMMMPSNPEPLIARATGWRQNTDERSGIRKGEALALNCTAGKRWQCGLSSGPPHYSEGACCLSTIRLASRPQPPLPPPPEKHHISMKPTGPQYSGQLLRWSIPSKSQRSAWPLLTIHC